MAQRESGWKGWSEGVVCVSEWLWVKRSGLT